MPPFLKGHSLLGSGRFVCIFLLFLASFIGYTSHTVTYQFLTDGCRFSDHVVLGGNSSLVQILTKIGKHTLVGFSLSEENRLHRV
jgi:hypothetical protein